MEIILPGIFQNLNAYIFSDTIAESLGATKERQPNCLIPIKLLELQKLFGEHSFLVRQPALEVIGYLNQIREATSAVNNARFILWGEVGSGKSSR